MTTEKKATRKLWFRLYRSVARLFIRRPKFIYLGERVSEPSLILSNHVGASAPLSWEIYFDYPFRFWGTHEMTEGPLSVYRYLSSVYFHQKKHMKKWLARLVALVATPLAWLFYRGLCLIPTYRDARFVKTVHESCDTLAAGQSLIIFPEDSSHGYFDNLRKFYSGFAVLAGRMLRQGTDLPVFVSYYKKQDCAFIIDRPVRFSVLSSGTADLQEIADRMCDRANALARVVSSAAEDLNRLR